MRKLNLIIVLIVLFACNLSMYSISSAMEWE